jgi:hypothetical protein
MSTHSVCIRRIVKHGLHATRPHSFVRRRRPGFAACQHPRSRRHRSSNLSRCRPASTSGRLHGCPPHVNRLKTANAKVVVSLKWSEREDLNLRPLVSQIDVTSFDFERGMLFLPDSKTGRKPVVLAAPAVAVLQDLSRMGEYVVVGNDLRHPRHDLQRPWHAITARAGLGGLRIHDLRHSFAATGAGSGFSLPIIGKLLGHRNLETTNRYAHLGASPLKTAADRIANQLADAMGDRGR